MHRLSLGLLSAASVDALLGVLYYNLREDFTIPHSALRTWGVRAQRPETQPVSDDLKQYAESLAQPFCGPSGNPEIAAWFGEAAQHVRSVAYMALREPGPAGAQGDCMGLLALGSEDVSRFYPEMGTVYLKRLGELASASLARFT
jgi:uncharacterized protein YigA (DUF484 family)